MRIAFFSAEPYDRTYFKAENQKYGFELEFFDTHLGPHSIALVEQFDAVCVFVKYRSISWGAELLDFA